MTLRSAKLHLKKKIGSYIYARSDDWQQLTRELAHMHILLFTLLLFIAQSIEWNEI